MDISRYVRTLQEQLEQTAGLAGDETTDVAHALTQSLDSALRLVILQALSEAAEEITAELAPGSVDVRLRGHNPEFVVSPSAQFDTTDTASPTGPAPSPHATGTAAGTDTASGESTDAAAGDVTAGAQTSRTTLRLPEALKTRAEAAAAREGLSVNTWLVRAIAGALNERSTPPGAPPRNNGTRFTGWVR